MSAPSNFVEISNQLDIICEALKKIHGLFSDDTIKTTGTFVMMFRNGEMNNIMQNMRLWRDVAHEEIDHWAATKDMALEQKGCYFRAQACKEMEDKNQDNNQASKNQEDKN